MPRPKKGTWNGEPYSSIRELAQRENRSPAAMAKLIDKGYTCDADITDADDDAQDRFYTVKEAARIHNVHAQMLTILLNDDERRSAVFPSAYKDGRKWMILASELAAYRPSAGQPRSRVNLPPGTLLTMDTASGKRQTVRVTSIEGDGTIWLQDVDTSTVIRLARVDNDK